MYRARLLKNNEAQECAHCVLWQDSETDKLCNRQRCLEKWESGDGGGDGGGGDDTCSLSLQDQLHGEHGRGGSYDCHQDQRR